MGGLTLGVNTLYRVFCFFKLFIIGGKRLSEKVYGGYFAFETLTERDWNEGICGVCGVCPLFKSGDGNCKNCTPVTKDMVSICIDPMKGCI